MTKSPVEGRPIRARPDGSSGWLVRHGDSLLIAAVVLLGGFVVPGWLLSGSDVAKYVIGVVIPIVAVLGLAWAGVRVARKDAEADAAYSDDPNTVPAPRTAAQRRGGWLLLAGFALFFLSTIPIVLYLSSR